MHVGNNETIDNCPGHLKGKGLHTAYDQSQLAKTSANDLIDMRRH
jgi:hypothetical protein